jgi:hypothetical protein
MFFPLILFKQYDSILFSESDMRKTEIKHFILVLATVLILGQSLVGTTYAVKNGTLDGTAHPYVCWIVTWDGSSKYVYLGTGSLIAPTVVLTAGHITQPPVSIAKAWVSFEPIANWPPWTSLPPSGVSSGWHEVDSWQTHPDYKMGGSKGLTDWITHDVGILILKDSIAPPYAELPYQGQMDTLPMKANLDLVGYGVQYQMRGIGVPPPDNWDWITFGGRYAAKAQLITGNYIMSDEFMRLTANPGQDKGGTCYGDSGSPILLAGTNTILGVCSWGTNGNCAGVSYDQRIDTADILVWIDSFLP